MIRDHIRPVFRLITRDLRILRIKRFGPDPIKRIFQLIIPVKQLLIQVLLRIGLKTEQIATVDIKRIAAALLLLLPVFDMHVNRGQSGP